jgi:small subunit ribosomal protein S6
MPLYDLMLLLDPGVPSDRQESILSDVKTQLESGGTLVGAHDWGQRRMTFEIDHRPDAAYHLIQFEADSGGALLNQVDHSLKITDGVLRHRIIRLKDGSPPPPAPQPDRRGYGDYDDVPPAPPAAAVDAVPGAVDAPAEAAAPADAPAPDAAVADAPTEAAPVEPATADAAPADAPPVADAPAEDAPAAEPEAAATDGGDEDEAAPSGPPAA